MSETNDQLELEWNGYIFARSGTSLFLTGVALSGKSTIARLLSSLIEDCAVQQTDMLRLIAQQIDRQKPDCQQNPVLNYGSCDSYVAMGDGSYSPERLVAGFNANAEAVKPYLHAIVTNLDIQNAQNMLFEGVHMTPSIVCPYLNGKNKLVVITSNAATLEANRTKTFGNDQKLLDRYSTEKLLLLQEEIIRQGRGISRDHLVYVNNTGSFRDTVSHIVDYLFDANVIERKG